MNMLHFAKCMDCIIAHSTETGIMVCSLQVVVAETTARPYNGLMRMSERLADFAWVEPGLKSPMPIRRRSAVAGLAVHRFDRARDLDIRRSSIMCIINVHNRFRVKYIQ